MSLTIAFGIGAVRSMGVIYVLMPVIMAVIGFIGFVIFAWMYNLLAQRLGGVELEVRDIDSMV